MARNVLKTMAKRTSEVLTLSGDTDSSAIDMKDYHRLLVSIVGATITGDITKFNLLAYSDSGLTTGETTIATGASFPTADGDYAFLEIDASELSSVGTDLRYVKAVVAGTDTDKVVLNVEQGSPAFCEDGLTADSIT